MDNSPFAKLTLFLNALGAIGILAMVLFINLDVIGRSAFNAPLPGVTEFVGLAIVAIVWLQAASTLRNGRFIRSDVFSSAIESRYPIVGVVLNLVYSLTGFVISAAIFFYSIDPSLKAYERGYYKGTFGVFTIPVWPVKVIILIGCATLAAQFLVFVVRDIRSLFDSSRREAQP